MYIASYPLGRRFYFWDGKIRFRERVFAEGKNGSLKKGKKDMTEKKKFNKKLIGGIALLIVLVAAFVIIFSVFGPKTVAGSKAITIEVVDKEQKSTMYELQTDAEFLRQAMEEAEGLEFSGTEGAYGLMIDTVNGLTANFNVDASYWGFFVNGEYSQYGIDTQPVMDGDAFQIVYTISVME